MPRPLTELNKKNSHLPPRSLTISAVNINSITAPERLQELSIFVEDNNVDVLALSELKIDSGVHHSLYHLNNFHLPIIKPRTRKGGGTAIYIRNSLPFTHLSTLDCDDIEAVWIKIRVDNECIIVCSCYLPPNAPAEKQIRFLDYFSDSVTQVQEHLPTAIIVAGDMNGGNCWLPESSPQHSPVTSFEKRLKNLSEELALTQLIRTPTRVLEGIHNIRDLVFIDRSDKVEKSGILPIFSKLDHTPVFVTLSLQHYTSYENPKTTVWDYKNTDVDMFVQILAQINWDIIITKDLDEAIRLLTSTLLDAATKCIPTKVIRLKQDKPWVTSELRQAMRKRDRLFKIARRRLTEHDWSRWRAQRNIVTSLNRKLKQENLKRKVALLLENRQDPFKYHTILKNITGFRRNETIPPLVEGDIISSDDASKAKAFNSYFCAQTDINVTQTQGKHLAEYVLNHPEVPNRLNTIEITPNDVLHVINGLDASKACGPDKLPTKIIKMTATYISEPLSKLFNRSLSEGKYPSSWKTATVKPVFKGKGSPSDIKNYRPISLLPCLSKIFEKLIFSRVYEHITSHSLLTEKQSGYRPGHSTEMQHIYLIDKLYKSLDAGNDFTVLYLDISRYFERIWHAGLLAKCNKEFGIGGALLQWLSSYLSDRNQVVQVGQQKSSPMKLKAGVPQGSVLGPLLAIMYINGLNDKTANDMLYFADDSSLHASHNPGNIHDVETKLQCDLDIILDYGTKWAITFNASKTTQQTFTNRIGTQAPCLLFDGKEVPLDDNHKHLGLTLSTDLRFKKHVNNILLKFNRALSPLYPIAKHIPKGTLLNIYYIYVQPHLDYCDSVFDGNLTDYDRARLEKAQLRAARLIAGTPRRTSSSALLQELGWCKLSERRQIHKIQLFHKLKFHLMVPEYIKTIIPNPRAIEMDRSLRSTSYVLTQPHARTTSYATSFIPSTTRYWNELPADITKQLPFKTFTGKLLELMAPPQPNPYFMFGTKLGNVLHTRLRLRSSQLNAHRRAMGSDVSPECSCGNAREDTQHYLLACPLYDAARQELYQTLTTILNSDFNRLRRREQFDILVNGPKIGHQNGKLVAFALQTFLIRTQRFT